MTSRVVKKKEEPVEPESINWLEFKEQESIFDNTHADCAAQYATSEETPMRKWENVRTKLSDLDTTKLHYVLVPEEENHIFIDFDIKDSEGNKSFERNLEDANKWPPTYAELSKSGAGIHLHYIYTGGDMSKLSRIYDENIEIKVCSGKSSLRRKLTKCNDLPIANISSGLPMKEGGKSVLNFDGIKNEKMLRSLLNRHLNKEIMGNTKPSIDMIKKCLDEAYESGVGYDVSDMKNSVIALAMDSSNQADTCLKIVSQMKWKSEEASETENASETDELVFYDVEVFPNLFLVNYKFAGEGKPVVRLINPGPAQIEELMRHKLVGFNNRSYDNHMLWACLIGYTNQQIYELSQNIINADKGDAMKYKFGEAYNISYADVYDFSSKKQSLKKFEIELGLKHHELGLPWDEPVPEELWPKVAEYCDDDVLATEAVFNARSADWTTRQLLAELSGLTVNDTNRKHITHYIFEGEKTPELLYTDLATGEQFPGR